MKLPLITAAYQARSLIASAQRCVNLYGEKNPEGEEFPFTYYPTPGLVRLATSEDSSWRGLYTATNGVLFGVVGRSVVVVNPDYTLNKIGTMQTARGPVRMIDNGSMLVVVDGTIAGYKADIETLAFEPINNDAFYGSNSVDLVDGFMIFNRINTQQWYITKLNELEFDALDFASKAGYPDKLVAVCATRRNVFLFGEQTTEIWTNVGGADFPFARVSGAFIQFGCSAPASIDQADGSIYFLSRSPEGQAMVMRTMNYDRERISTFAIENELQSYERIDDAIGFVMQVSGHYWYVLTFPTANKTWVFDASNGGWHELAYLEEDGSFTRHRANCYAFWNGKHIVGDYADGRLYELRLDAYTDDGNEIRRVRSFPHLAEDGNRVVYKRFQAAMQVGDAQYSQSAEIRLRYSDTKGASWSGAISSTLGARGDYLRDCQFLRLGMARSRVFELSWSASCPTALNGAYIQVQRAET